jgi:hypothetical protein
MTDPVLAGLMKRREELVVEVRRLEIRFQETLTYIEQLDAAIWQFDPDYKPLHPAVRTVQSLPLGRTLLSVLRRSTKPLTLREMTLGMMEALGLDRSNEKRIHLLVEQARRSMHRQKRNGIVVSEQAPMGKAMVWRIAG